MNEPVMTPNEALIFLDTACASVAMGRPAHIKGIQAVQVLRQFVPVETGDNGKDAAQKEEDNGTTETKAEN